MLKLNLQVTTLRAAVTVTYKHRSCPLVPENGMSRSAEHFFDKCQTTGVEGQVVHGFDPHHKSEKTLFKNTF